MADPPGPEPHEPARIRPLRRLTTPRAAAYAGVVFALLCGTSITLLATLPRDSAPSAEWLHQADAQVRVALTLTPFAGVAFLWFIGVLRDRLGDLEDRFFSTIVLGSGLLFLATYFVAMAIAGGLIAGGAVGSPTLGEDVVQLGRAIMLQTFNGFALRMAGTFMIALGTMWLRTGLLPRWLAALTYLAAAALLIVVSHNLFVFLVFPSWVLLVSLVHLVRPRAESAPGVHESTVA